MKGSIAIGTAPGAHDLDHIRTINIMIILMNAAAEVLDSGLGQAVVEEAQVDIQALLGGRRQKDEGA